MKRSGTAPGQGVQRYITTTNYLKMISAQEHWVSVFVCVEMSLFITEITCARSGPSRYIHMTEQSAIANCSGGFKVASVASSIAIRRKNSVWVC